MLTKTVRIERETLVGNFMVTRWYLFGFILIYKSYEQQTYMN